MLAGGDAGDGQSVGWVGLAGAAEPAAFPDRQRTRHLAHVQAGISEQAGHTGAEVGGALDADAANGAVLLQPGGQLPVAGWGVGEHCRVKAAAGLVDQADRQGVFVAVDAGEQVDHLHVVRDDGVAARRHALG